ncbi:uncharacterized protein UTRI_04164 [Ustilago trichophora]|uniref:Uncharacterized protein n=1 Tax=Ustilago trichophora TaxID=86804 RepID=A0A5C3E928_9BASI|nr:uncharacterized protein UTRI_04164 [Ustilago trichophora]
MKITRINTYTLFSAMATTLVLAVVTPKEDLRKAGKARILKCHVQGEDSPEAALRQVDPHALKTMYCSTGCDYAVNHAIPHGYATYVDKLCDVTKEEHDIEYKKYTSKDDKNDRKRSSHASIKRRDIDAYTVGSATFTFTCSDHQGVDYTQIAANRIGLDLSICNLH